jgi:putative ABC transport system permease protein
MPDWPRHIGEELRQHLDDEYDERRAAGESHEEAMRGLARDIEAISSRRLNLCGFGQDLRFGARLFVKDRGTSLVVVFTLALAIAANAIVFGFADLLILRPLPLDNAARLVTIYGVDRRLRANRERLSIADYLDLEQQATSFAAVAGMTTRQASLTGSGEPLAVTVNFVTANLLATWGVKASIGRTFLPEEAEPGHARVAILSHHFWAAHFASDPAVIGRALTVNGESHTLAGVLTPSVEIGDLGEIDLWVPLDTSRAAESRGERALEVVGLLGPTATLESANAELTTIGERLQRADPLNHVDWQLRAVTLRESTVGSSTWVILALLGTVTMLVLVVACANVATVMLSRASARRKEIAVRLALGATRARLVRQLFSEGLMLGVVGGACGLAVAYTGLLGFKKLSPEPYFQLLAVNGNLITFAFALSVLTPVLFGVLPALQSSRPDLNEDLKDGGRDASVSVRGNRSRAVLLVAQVASALTVLIVAGLVVRTVVAIEHIPIGFMARGMLTARVRFDPPKYMSDDERRRAVESILDRLGATPGVVAAAAADRLPLIDGEPIRRFAIGGRAAPTPADLPSAAEVTTLGDYTRALGLTLVEGRMWRAEESTRAVAAVNREAARRYWPGQSPIGEHIAIVDANSGPTGASIEIVAVVDNVRSGRVTQPPPPRLYRPLGVRPLAGVVFLVRAQDDAGGVAPPIRDALRSADRDLAVSEVRPFTAELASFLRTNDLILLMFVGFAIVGLVVAVTGVYGVTAFSVSQRRHEIGVRMALGATAADVVRLIIGRSVRLIVIGVAAGVAAGLAMGRTMSSILVDTSPFDPATYITVVALIVSSGLVAGFVPASRAVSIDPIAVLKRQ